MLEEVVERVLKEYLNVKYEFQDAGPVVHCPWHDDSTPSLQLRFGKTSVKATCYACGHEGDLIAYVAAVKKTEQVLVKRDLERQFGYEKGKIIDVDIIEKYHKAIWDADDIIALYARGVSKDTIRRFRLGYNAGRITIPIPNRYGMFVNLRRYRPGAAKQKMTNQRGHGKIPRLYPISQLEYDNIIICGGEVKSLATLQRMNAHGYGAICSTAGETKWFPEYNEEFRGKRVWVMMDIDQAGVTAAEQIARVLHLYAEWLGVVMLPLDAAKHPKGDVNDFFHEGGDLLPVLEKTPRYVPRYEASYQDNEIYDVALNESVDAKFTAKRVRTRALVSAVQEAPFTVPKTIRVDCDKSLPCCGVCPVFPMRTDAVLRIASESAQMLALVDASKKSHGDSLKEAVGIPPMCKASTFEPLDFHHVEECRVSPELDLEATDNNRELLPAYFIGSPVELNETYEVMARVHPHPKSQVTTLVATDYNPVEDTLSQYEDDQLGDLTLFRPKEWSIEGIDAKLEEIYYDFACNVTGIFLRPELHAAVDLAYHSLLSVQLRGMSESGWVQTLIIGDSAQGKTMVSQKLLQHYRCGSKVDCKNATTAGLIGGLQQINGRWFVTWGAVPLNDRRLVILEELKGLPVETIAKMTEMRSSGIAQIPKIENRKRLARCRLVALSNPRDNRRLEDRSKGVFAIKDLVGSLEDIRRFDMALGISATDMPSDKLNEYQVVQPETPHIYTSELCHRLVLYAWTRDRVEIVDDEHLLKVAVKLSRDLACSSLPLVDAGSIKWKLLRLATSLAVRTFSTTEDFQHPLVRPCHVDWVDDFLRTTYSHDALSYNRYAQMSKTEQLRYEDELIAWIRNTPHAKDFAILSLDADNGFDHTDLMDWCGFDRDMAQSATSFLVRCGAIRRFGQRYKNTGPYILLLKRMLDEDIWTDLSHIDPEDENEGI